MCLPPPPLTCNEAAGAGYVQHQHAINDLCEVCLFAARCGARVYPISDLSRLFSLAAGVAMDGNPVFRRTGRACAVERAFLCREVIYRDVDRLIGKRVDPPPPNGPYEGERTDHDKREALLGDY